MKLFYVENGYSGDLPMLVLVVAKNRKEAIAMALPVFEKESRGYDLGFLKLKAEIACNDVSQPWVSGIGEGSFDKA